MGRAYKFTFQRGADDVVEVTGIGNTRRSAERGARTRLRKLFKLDGTSEFRVVGSRHVGDGAVDDAVDE